MLPEAMPVIRVLKETEKENIHTVSMRLIFSTVSLSGSQTMDHDKDSRHKTTWGKQNILLLYLTINNVDLFPGRQ